MTLNEFKAWLEGYSEAIGDAPTKKQWAVVKAKLGKVSEPLPLDFGKSPFDTGRLEPWVSYNETALPDGMRLGESWSRLGALT